MQSSKIRLLVKKDLTIIYKQGKHELHEIKASKNDFLRALRYYENQRNEINHTNLVYIQEDIPFNIFEEFITSMSTNEIEINSNNYEGYYYLSNKYQYEELLREVEEFISKRPDVCSILNDLSNNQDQHQEENFNSENEAKEKLISENLDIALQNGNIDNLPLSMLIRIFKSPSRQLKDHHLLYNFIIKKIQTKPANKTEEELLFILPSSLDFMQMTNEEIEELFELEKSSNFLNPSNSNERMKKFINKEKELCEKFDKLEENIKKMKLKSDKQEELILNSNKVIQSMIERIDLLEKCQKSEIEKQNLLEKQVEDERSNSNLKSEKDKLTEKQLKDEIKELKEKIEFIEKDINKFKKINNDEHMNIKSSVDQTNSSINSVKTKIDEVNDPISILTKVCPYKEGIELNGIIQYMTNKIGENIHDNGIIKVTSNYTSRDHPPRNLLNFSDNDCYYHTSDCDKTDAIICYDFKNYVIEITHYTIKSSPTSGYIKSWVIEVSNDKQTWIPIDEQTNCSDLNGPNKMKTFKVRHNNFSRYCRLRQNGDYWSSCFYLRIGSIEFYGRIQTFKK